MDKQEIVNEIKRTAAANGGQPYGRERFERETAIKTSDWFGIHWASWGEALTESGFAPNSFQTGLPESELIEKFIEVMREVGDWPTDGKLRLVCHGRDDLPGGKTLLARLGRKFERAQKVLDHCESLRGYDDVVAICENVLANQSHKPVEEADTNETTAVGFVYLMKHGKFHKVGRSNSVGRREYELGTKLPEKLETLHEIKTDDPEGVERYWHNRFAGKRQEGEWFKLTAADVRAFKRWKRIY